MYRQRFWEDNIYRKFSKGINLLTKKFVLNNESRKRGGRKMNSKRFLTLLTGDRQLLATFSGMVFSFVAIISLAIMAGIWYL